MKLFGKFLAIASVGVMTATVPMSNASAQGDYPSAYGWSPQDGIMAGDPNGQRPRWHYRGGGGKHFRNGGRNFNNGVRHHNRGVRHHNRGHSNDGLALGLGIVAGALALGVIANSQRTYDVQPHVSHSSGMAPWSPGWYRYCDKKYRSFNASTGTYRGYDGRDHFCVVN